MTGRNRIMIYGPKEDGSYVVEFRTADGDVLAISIQRNETAVIKHFQERMPYGLFCRTTPVRYLGPLGASARLQPPRPMFFHLLRGRADGAVPDFAQCGLASIVLGADDPILLHNGSVGRKDRAPKPLDDGPTRWRAIRSCPA